MTEYVYHVDEDDNVIGSVARDEADDKILRYRTTSVMVFNPKGKLLVTKRSAQKKKFPGYFELKISGGVDYGETYEEAAKRELREEVGIQADKLEFLFKINVENSYEKLFVVIFKYVYDGLIRIQKSEIDEYKWLSPVYVDNLITNENVDPGSIMDWEKYNETCLRI